MADQTPVNGSFCPVELILTGDDGQETVRLGIVTHDLDLSVGLWESSTIFSDTGTERLGGRAEVKGTVVVVFDVQAIPWLAAPVILPGVRCRLVSYLANAELPADLIAVDEDDEEADETPVTIRTPVRVERLRGMVAIDKAVLYTLDVVMDCAGRDNVPEYVQFQ